MRHIAFVGTPIHLKDLVGWIRTTVSLEDSIESLKQSIRTKFNVKHCFFVSSGRAALLLLLQSLRKLSSPGKSYVIIPSYTCYSVPAAVVRAGLKIRICDIDKDTLDYNINKLSSMDFSDVLCIVTSNLFGIPDDLIALEKIASEKGVFLIDDAAQCMGGKVQDRYSGTLGDAGIYSLGIGKNITSIQGGIIVTNSDNIATLLSQTIIHLPEMSYSNNILNMVQLIGYAIFLHPSLCWMPANLSFLNLESNKFETDFSVKSYSNVLGAMAMQLFNRLDEISEIRIRKARYLEQHLNIIDSISLIRHHLYTSPVYLRFPILIDNSKIRDAVIRVLREKRLGVAEPYPYPVSDISEKEHNDTSEDRSNGRFVASQLITLPTHPYASENDLDTIISVIKAEAKTSS